MGYIKTMGKLWIAQAEKKRKEQAFLNDLSFGFSMSGIGFLSSLSAASQQCKQA